MKQLTLIMILVFCTSSYAFSQSNTSIATIDSIRVEMQQFAKENELHNLAKFYSDDAFVNGFDGSYSGIDEIRNYWKSIRGKGINWEWSNLKYSGSESFITQTGTSLLTLQYGEKVVTFSSQFSVVWEKQIDESYKIISDFYRTNEKKNVLYEIKKDSVWIVNKTDSIFGILYSPLNLKTKKSPAVLCLQGGGNVGLSNYLFEAQYFAENGITALVCDKAGAGQSKGKSSWVTQTFQEKTKEYYQLIKWLKEQSSVDAEKVGVHGLSEGGRLALNLAINYPDEIAFVNAVSAPIESFKENQLFAIYNLLYDRNFDFSVINQAIYIWNEYFEGVANRDIQKTTIEKANGLRAKEPNLYLPPNSTELPERPQPDDINFSLNQINQIECPVLFQFGQEDKRVNTLKSISLIEDKHNFQIELYSQTDHSMNHSNGVINENFLLDKYQWLKSNKLIK